MKQNIAVQLREFWDVGIRGPDFVWAATGPAMEAYSKYPVVKKANEPGKIMEVSEIPLIDQIHRLMHLWKAGELVKVDEYLDTRALLKNKTFHQVFRAVIELAPAGSEELSVLESISNQLKSRGVAVEDKQKMLFQEMPPDESEDTA